MKKEKIASTIVGAAGEHFVMAELLRRGHIAALAPQGAPNMDILIADRSGQQLFSLQVKTRTSVGGDGGWHMSSKHEGIKGERLFYVFVDMGKPLNERPDCFILPADLVAEMVFETHRDWERNPGKAGQTRAKGGPMRRIRPDYFSIYTAEPPKYTQGWMEPYREAWQVFEN
ncbi:hypothetical protein [Thalassobius sp. I31.1]|uniref:hypothetical protein n=1 Tax=Thalassobius sp. I31.1 TaxID=2109912 RepID=UPI000D1B7D83|nr:hypothetical protein [Thalassobius sp. I31.1]